MPTLKLPHMSKHPLYPHYKWDVNMKPKRWITYRIAQFRTLAEANKALTILQSHPFDPEAAVKMGISGNTEEQQLAISDYLTNNLNPNPAEEEHSRPARKRK